MDRLDRTCTGTARSQVTAWHICGYDTLVITCQNFSGCALFPFLPPFGPSDLVSCDDGVHTQPNLRIFREQGMHAMCRCWRIAPSMRTYGRLLQYGARDEVPSLFPLIRVLYTRHRPGRL